MLTDIALGQYYPGNSLIHKLDPRTKILITLFFIVAIFLASGAVSYGILWGFVFLIILLSPILLILSIWIKLDSKGPVFYRPERITQY